MNDDVIEQADNYLSENKKIKNAHIFPKLSDLPLSILNWIDKNSPSLICLWDKEANLLFITESISTILGYPATDLLGDQWKKMLSNENIHNFYRHIGESKQTNSFYTTIMNHKQIPIAFKVTLKRIEDETNDSIYYVSLLEKKARHNKAEEMLVQSEKMSIAGQLAAGIAHEIRNPLTSLKGFLQLLQADVEKKEIYYKIMIEEIEKIEMITSELLYISKPVTAEKQLESVYSMIKDVTILLGSQARMKNIDLHCSMNKELLIYCNRSQIKQVFINIIKNAIEAMEKSGAITIGARLTPHKIIEIDIIDEGPGITQDILQKIEEPFFTTKKSGTGLGLMITKQILEKQFGRLQIIQSDHNGSIFRITFPEP